MNEVFVAFVLATFVVFVYNVNIVLLGSLT